MQILFHIIKFKILSFAKTTFDLRLASVVKGVASLVVFGGFAIGAYSLSYELTRFVLEQTRTGLFLYHRFISMMLFVFFVSVNLGNIIVSYATLYRSSEVRYLLTKPIPYRSVFVLKFFDNFLYSSTTLFFLAFAVLAGYGSYFGYSWLAMGGIMLFVLIPFMFLSACLGVLILMGIMKVAGRWGFRKVMTFLAAGYLAGVYLFFKFTNPIKLVEEVFKYYPNVNLYLGHLDPQFMKFLPNHWVAELLFFLSKGSYDQAWPYGALLLLITAIVFLIVLFVGGRFYYQSWLISLLRSGIRRPIFRWFPSLFDLSRRSNIATQLDVLVKKETLQFFRDPSQWIHLSVMVMLCGVFAISVHRLKFRFDVPDLPALTYLVLFAFGGFLVAALALRFVFPMISLEGRSFWILRSSPLSPRKIFFTKFFMALIVVTLLGGAVAVFSNLPFVREIGHGYTLLIFGSLSALWISLSMVAINLGMGGYFVSYHEKNPIRIASSQGATLTFLANLVYLVLLVAILAFPVSRYFSSLLESKVPNEQAFMMSGIVMVLLSVITIVFGVIVGLRSLKRDF